MALQEETRRNIEKITGQAFSKLLESNPTADSRLQMLKRQPRSTVADSLIRGNPQLTMGYSTPKDAVDAYFEQRKK